jgi:hypothetical protein
MAALLDVQKPTFSLWAALNFRGRRRHDRPAVVGQGRNCCEGEEGIEQRGAGGGCTPHVGALVKRLKDCSECVFLSQVDLRLCLDEGGKLLLDEGRPVPTVRLLLALARPRRGDLAGLSNGHFDLKSVFAVAPELQIAHPNSHLLRPQVFL